MADNNPVLDEFREQLTDEPETDLVEHAQKWLADYEFLFFHATQQQIEKAHRVLTLIVAVYG